jgi:Ca2+-transporting ATPase
MRNQNYDCDPFLFMNSFVKEGNCKALVCCVGTNSSNGSKTKKLDLNNDTPLGHKLNNLADQFMKYALMSSGVVLLVLIFRMFIEVAAVSGDDELSGAGVTILTKLTKHFNIFVVLIVVSVPEGLPLSIQISLGFSVFKMIEQKILVRNLDAPEKMGSIEQICCGKTATLTQNEMKVN